MPFPEDLPSTKPKTRNPGKGVNGRAPVNQKVRGSDQKKSCSSHKGRQQQHGEGSPRDS